MASRVKRFSHSRRALDASVLRTWRLVAAVAIIAVVAIGAWLWTGGKPNTEVPVIAAEATPEKVKPADEGGLQVQNQDVQVLDPSTQVQGETVMPEPEQPIARSAHPAAALLDHVVLIYGYGMADGNAHAPTNLPILVLGGGAGTLSDIGVPAEVGMAKTRSIVSIDTACLRRTIPTFLSVAGRSIGWREPRDPWLCAPTSRWVCPCRGSVSRYRYRPRGNIL